MISWVFLALTGFNLMWLMCTLLTLHWFNCGGSLLSTPPSHPYHKGLVEIGATSTTSPSTIPTSTNPTPIWLNKKTSNHIPQGSWYYPSPNKCTIKVKSLKVATQQLVLFRQLLCSTFHSRLLTHLVGFLRCGTMSGHKLHWWYCWWFRNPAETHQLM